VIFWWVVETDKPVIEKTPPKGKKPPAKSPPPAKGKATVQLKNISPAIAPEPSNVTEEEPESKTTQTSAKPANVPKQANKKKGGNQPASTKTVPPSAPVTAVQDNPVSNIETEKPSTTEPAEAAPTSPKTSESAPTSPKTEYNCAVCHAILTKENATVSQLKKGNDGKCKSCTQGQTAQQQPPKKKN